MPAFTMQIPSLRIMLDLQLQNTHVSLQHVSIVFNLLSLCLAKLLQLLTLLLVTVTLWREELLLWIVTGTPVPARQDKAVRKKVISSTWYSCTSSTASTP